MAAGIQRAGRRMTDDQASKQTGGVRAAERSGIVTLVGRANVGKSTLLNRFTGEKVSIVSDVAQTTRNLIRAVLTEARGQLVFLDTPGLHQASYDLGRIMNRTARTAIEGTDICLFLVDASLPPREEDRTWMRRLAKAESTCVPVLNKADKHCKFASEYQEYWGACCAEQAADTGAEWQTISALTGAGTEQLLATLFEKVPPGPQLFPDDLLTDFPRKLAMADLIREKLFLLLRDEVPHAVAVQVNRIEDADDPWSVFATIYVNRPSQNGIIIGHKGRFLRKVRRQSEADLEQIYEHPVHLELWVKVEKHWARNHWILKQLGYV